MTSGTGNIEQLELIHELRQRFPLIEQLVGKFGKDMPEERIPWFFALLLSAATNGDPGPCCFVLDKTKGTTALVAVLLALVRLQDEIPNLLRNYAKTALSPGQRVRIKPSNHVYEYGGIWEDEPDFFQLKVLDNPSSRRSFPIKEVVRLEPTTRLRPKGKLSTPLKKKSNSHLDELLGITTCGNKSVIRNEVLLYMPKARFADVIRSVAIAIKNNTDKFKNLSDFLPWGTFQQDGELKLKDAHQLVGEPLIAVTRVPEDLALASSTAPEGTKFILVDGARGLARDLQAFDDLTERQKVVIFASSEEKEELGLLRDRECPIWYMSPDEILIGETSNENRKRSSLVGATIRAGETRRSFKVTIVDCHDSMLQKVAESLENAENQIKSSDESEEGTEIIWRLYGILLECSECCFGVGEEIKTRLRTAQDKVKKYGQWLNPEVASNLCEATDQLKNIIENGTYGQEKATKLRNFILGENHGLRLVAARTPQSADNLRTGLGGVGTDVCVLPIPAIAPDRDYTTIILPAWPNRERFSRLTAQAVTSDIRVLAYPFEKKWVMGHLARENQQERSNRIAADTRSSILGIEPRFLNSLGQRRLEQPVSEIRSDLPIFSIEDWGRQRRIARPSVAGDFEENREAQLVQFTGGCYALMTEWAELPRLNQLIDGTNETDLELVPVSRLSPGDYVLFRASGDKEFLRLVAEEILGEEEYERHRNTAELWKFPLRSLGSNPNEVQQSLAVYGLNRTAPTIRGWLYNEDRIGPGDFSDIKFIAKAAGDEKLLSNRREVEIAISRIRGIHISAGRLLTQLLLGELSGRLNRLDEQPMLLKTDYGEAWVVHVQMVEKNRHKYSVNIVNRLLWTEDEGF